VHWKKCLDSKPTFPQGNRKKRRIGNKKQDLAIISNRHLGKGLTRKNNINSTENTKHRKRDLSQFGNYIKNVKRLISRLDGVFTK